MKTQSQIKAYAAPTTQRLAGCFSVFEPRYLQGVLFDLHTTVRTSLQVTTTPLPFSKRTTSQRHSSKISFPRRILSRKGHSYPCEPR
jgi:hypothetical protein